MENLLNQLGDVINIIATQLGYSVEFVKANFETYLLEFGKYSLIENIPMALVGGLLIAGLIFVVLLGIGVVGIDITDTHEGEEKFVKYLVTSGAIAMVIGFLSPITIEVTKFLVSPMMYSINEAIKLLK